MSTNQIDPNFKYSRRFYVKTGIAIIYRSFVNVPGHVRSKTAITRGSMEHVFHVWLRGLISGTAYIRRGLFG